MVDALDPYSFGCCLLPEAYLIYVTSQEMAVPAPSGFSRFWSDGKTGVSMHDMTRERKDGLNHLRKVVSMRHWTVSKDSLNYACLLEADIDYT